MTLTATTTTAGALFNLDSSKHAPTSNSPVMTGNIEIGPAKIELAAFLKIAASSGIEYLNLKLKTEKPVYGRLFRNLEKKSENSPDYTGFLNVNDDKLKVSGWKVRPEGKKAYISLAICPFISSNGEGDDLPI